MTLLIGITIQNRAVMEKIITAQKVREGRTGDNRDLILEIDVQLKTILGYLINI